jgi:ubiquinone/menaquinone biosynthesis C-methylase UbiE
MPVRGAPFGRAGRFGPDAYDDWRAETLGGITEDIERRLVLRLAGDLYGCRILDIGCGDGALGLELWRRGASFVVGCDPDPRMVARATAAAAERRAPARYAIAAAERLPFGDRSFDIVTMITVLAFVPRPESALDEIARVLTPGGRLVLADLGRWSLWAASRRIRGWLGLAPLWRAAKFRSAGELRTLLRSAGFGPERVSGAVYYPRSALLARLMRRLDPWLGELTTFGAAFVAILARNATSRLRRVEPDQGGRLVRPAI